MIKSRAGADYYVRKTGMLHPEWMQGWERRTSAGWQPIAEPIRYTRRNAHNPMVLAVGTRGPQFNPNAPIPIPPPTPAVWLVRKRFVLPPPPRCARPGRGRAMRSVGVVPATRKAGDSSMTTYFILYCSKTARTQFRITVSDAPLPPLLDPPGTPDWVVLGVFTSADALSDSLASHLKMAETV